MRVCTPSVQKLRREQVDFSCRTRPVIAALLRKLEDSGADRADLRRRLADYVQSFDPGFVDFVQLNQRLTAAGLEPLPDGRTQRADGRTQVERIPEANLLPEQRRALIRARRFYEVELQRRPTSKDARGEVEAVVKAVCGDMLTADEYATALTMLNNANRL